MTGKRVQKEPENQPAVPFFNYAVAISLLNTRMHLPHFF